MFGARCLCRVYPHRKSVDSKIGDRVGYLSGSHECGPDQDQYNCKVFIPYSVYPSQAWLVLVARMRSLKGYPESTSTTAFPTLVFHCQQHSTVTIHTFSVTCDTLRSRPTILPRPTTMRGRSPFTVAGDATATTTASTTIAGTIVVLLLSCWLHAIPTEAFPKSPVVRTRRIGGGGGTLSSRSATGPHEPGTTYALTVTYEGRACQLHVRDDETILAAMERSKVSRELCLPELPADCRRGNCLTCTAQHGDTSRTEHLRRGEDGLAPSSSAHVADQGYVLTCSSYVTGNGVVLQLGENRKVWDDVYQRRWQTEDHQLIARAAKAKTIRMYAERNVPEWTAETEQVYRKSEDLT